MATPSEDLQKVIYTALTTDAAVSAIVGNRVSDGLPTDYPSITFGPSDYVLEDMDCIDGREETIQLDCWARDGKRLRPAKALADAVKAALHNKTFSMDTHALTRIYVESVRAFMDADGLTGHAAMSIVAEIEER